MKTYRTLNQELRKIFGEKVVKISVNGNFSCPNRDGTSGNEGCIFCSENGSGEFAGNPELSITEQIKKQIEIMNKKWKSDKYIIYFGAYTGTYAPVHILREKFYEALKYPGVIGLAVATRPDCIDGEVAELLNEINKKYFLWIELGLQTIHKKTSENINRGYSLSVFEKAYKMLYDKNIRIVVHLIIGLPGENRKMILETIEYFREFPVWGIKIHSLYVVRNTRLYRMYLQKKFELMQKEEYVKLVCDCLERLHEDCIIHRVTGDGKKEDLEGPDWTKDKLRVISDIDSEMLKRKTYQGKYF